MKTISKEKTLINALSSKKFETTELDIVCINLKMNFSENVSMEVLCERFIYLLITNQPVQARRKQISNDAAESSWSIL